MLGGSAWEYIKFSHLPLLNAGRDLSWARKLIFSKNIVSIKGQFKSLGNTKTCDSMNMHASACKEKLSCIHLTNEARGMNVLFKSHVD